MNRWILPALEKFVPTLPNHIRYLKHVRMSRDFVYQDVTTVIFRMIGSRNKIGIDVGANLGIFTRYLRNHFLNTVAVEPIPELAEKIKRIFGTSVQVENCALGSNNGQIVLRTPIDAFGNL